MARPVKLQAGEEFNATSLKGNPVRVTLLKEIGVGGSSTVFEGQTNSGRKVVVKAPRGKQADEFAFKAERQILQTLKSPNLPTLYGYHEASKQILLVFEKLYPNPLLYMNRKALRGNIKVIYDSNAHYIPLPGPTALNLSRELLLAIDTLHRQKFAHCDVKLANFMIRVEQKNVTVNDHEYFQRVRNDAYRGVLIDAGGVRGFDYLGSLNSSGGKSGKVIPQCTPLYSPPEVIADPHLYSPSMDVYAAALSIYTLITGHVPYSHTERQIDPTDLVSVWEFKLAEKRGEISPISEDAIQRVFFPDSDFRNGSRVRDEFNESLYSFLDHYSSPDHQDRGDIHTMLDDFSKLFRFVSTGKTDKDVFIPGVQGMFSSESTLDRLFEAPGPVKAEGKKESVRLKRDSGMVPVVESSESIRSKLAKKRPDMAPIAQRPKSTVRLRRRDQQGGSLLSSPSNESAPSAPMAPPQTSPKIVVPETNRFNRAKALSEIEGKASPKPSPEKRAKRPPPKRRSDKPPASKRRPTDAPKSKPSALPPPPVSKEHEKKALESQKAVVDSLFSRAKRKSKNRVIEGGKTLDQFIREAEKGREPYFKAFPYPILYLEETESRPSKQEAETEQVLCTLQAPETPCVFPLATSSGKAARCLSVGRSQERDIRINAPSISKLHAAFSRNATRNQWMMADLGSTNDSWVNSRKLEPLVPALLENHNRVILGGESFIYFTAEGFYSYLSSIDKES